MASKRVILIIMDGWGLGKVASADAIQHSKTPFTTALYGKYPHTTLITCGEAVGLPDGQMGNSEVGHLNLGAGRVVYQELQRINVAVRDGSFGKNEVMLRSIRTAKEKGRPLHLLGLVSNGGVHSHINHLKAILDVCKSEGLKDVFIHAFTDGRDCDPKSGLGFITELQAHCNKVTGKIATVSGRYYAMDRDKRWERVKLAYDALVNGVGAKSTDAIAAVENAYNRWAVSKMAMWPFASTSGPTVAARSHKC
jgi:2,3-bisphosphoglycerate-independent phosphoglycerate mutase